MATIDPVGNGDLIRTTWGNAVANELNTQSVKYGGGTMTGYLNGPGFFLTEAQSVHAHGLTRRDYVDAADATKAAKAGDTFTGAVYVGNFPTEANDGLGLNPTGGISSAVTVGGTTTVPNLGLSRAGTGGVQDIGGRYVRFDRTTLGTTIGSITIASASSVAYNTTSDPRLKQVTGDVDDAADIAHDLGAKAFRGRWIADQDQGAEWVFLNSTDIEAVAPYAVTGAADATDADGIVPQQANYPALVPLLFAALSQALDRIAALEAAAT